MKQSPPQCIVMLIKMTTQRDVAIYSWFKIVYILKGRDFTFFGNKITSNKACLMKKPFEINFQVFCKVLKYFHVTLRMHFGIKMKHWSILWISHFAQKCGFQCYQGFSMMTGISLPWSSIMPEGSNLSHLAT